MKIERKNIVIGKQLVSYLVEGDVAHRPTLIFLHGWRSEAQVWMDCLHEASKKGYAVIALDLPGFGKSQNPREPFTLDHYSTLLELLVAKLRIRKPVLVGHSFGGRIALKYASRHSRELEKLVLVGSAGLRRPSSSRSFKKVVAKVVKPFFKPAFMHPLRERIYYAMGSYDYVSRTDLRETFVNIIEEDLTGVLENVTVPTLLLWGEKDMQTTIEDGALMNALLPNSQMIEIRNAGHYVFLDDSETFLEELFLFVKS